MIACAQFQNSTMRSRRKTTFRNGSTITILMDPVDGHDLGGLVCRRKGPAAASRVRIHRESQAFPATQIAVGFGSILPKLPLW
jgi:hypothetical protein